ncbi:hypothetical protein EAG_09873 [Camponotus floridanus]|uniref:Uncharacterized protein n=1 Tax=Camponotus floridanus TaxID=104421 RepID=E2A699_CAMFO|nr:hypothetical protein EAG_09873 [Camponotus floridanus]
MFQQHNSASVGFLLARTLRNQYLSRQSRRRAAGSPVEKGRKYLAAGKRPEIYDSAPQSEVQLSRPHALRSTSTFVALPPSTSCVIKHQRRRQSRRHRRRQRWSTTAAIDSHAKFHQPFKVPRKRDASYEWRAKGKDSHPAGCCRLQCNRPSSSPSTFPSSAHRDYVSSSALQDEPTISGEACNAFGNEMKSRAVSSSEKFEIDSRRVRYRAPCTRDNDVNDRYDFPTAVAKDFSPRRIPLCVQPLKICGKQYELNLLSVQIPNELPYQTRKGSSAEIVAKKNSKSYSLRRVMELKDLELGTQGGSPMQGALALMKYKPPHRTIVCGNAIVRATLEMHQSRMLHAAKRQGSQGDRALPRILSPRGVFRPTPCANNITEPESVGAIANANPGKVERATPERDATGAILPVIKTFGGNPAVCMGFSPTTVSTSSLGFSELNFANAVCANHHVMQRDINI